MLVVVGDRYGAELVVVNSDDTFTTEPTFDTDGKCMDRCIAE
ncbi:MAG: hypothetical protein AAF808_17785 [Cyanobacteria bacterium P01_D01_bin.2]